MTNGKLTQLFTIRCKRETETQVTLINISLLLVLETSRQRRFEDRQISRGQALT